MKRLKHLFLFAAVLFSFCAKAQDAAAEAVNQVPGQHFGLNDEVWLGIFMTTAMIFTVIILMVNSTIRNLAETKRLWTPKVKEGAAAVALLLVAGTASAQAGEAAQEPLYSLSDSAFWAMLAANVFLMGYTLLQLRLLRGITKKIAGIEDVEPAFVPEKERTPVWEVIWQKLNDHRAVKEEKDIMLDHNYDGIRELDNNLPPWWKWGFYFTIGFGVVYYTHYHVTKTGALPKEELAIALEEGEREVEAYLAKAAMNVDESNVKYVLADDRLNAGKSVFDANCKVCHGGAGEGGVGPNLTDPYWIHGGSIGDVFKTVKYGIPAKGMKSWKADLTPIQIQNVSTYVMSLQGTTPDNAKEAQGDFVEPAVPEGDEGAAPEKPEATETEDTADADTEDTDLVGAVQ
jgi:cytochrome c oxidase cbb3-type subunit 3